MILACHNIEKSFGEQVIVHDGSFHIEDREKAALVGVNGAGKSTILKMIMGEEPLDGGDIILAKGRTIGYLAQHQSLLSGSTIYEEVKSARADIFAMEEQLRSIEQELKSLSGDALKDRLETYNRLQSDFEARNGYACESEIVGVLKGLGFTEEEFGKRTDTLSGGQKTRVSLGKLLLTRPDILLLDEPTNHLDLNSIAWLETFLMNYPGAVFIVSHDRYFLNRVVTKVIEIERGEIRMYLGNYKAYAEKKQQIRDARTHITYCKNMMLSEADIHSHRVEGMDFPAVYFEYQDFLRRSRLMDFDDQMVFALRILRREPELLRHYRTRYRWLCLDEAQDTSKIQHVILALLAQAHRELFLVGDEDQSIYGFRGADPQGMARFWLGGSPVPPAAPDVSQPSGAGAVPGDGEIPAARLAPGPCPVGLCYKKDTRYERERKAK